MDKRKLPPLPDQRMKSAPQKPNPNPSFTSGPRASASQKPAARTKAKTTHIVLAACLVVGLLVALTAIINIITGFTGFFFGTGASNTITEAADSAAFLYEAEEEYTNEAEDLVSENLDHGLIDFEGSDLTIKNNPDTFTLVYGSHYQSPSGGASYQLVNDDGTMIQVEQMMSSYPFTKSEEEEYFKDDMNYMALEGSEKQFYILQENEDGYLYTVLFVDQPNNQTIRFSVVDHGQDSVEKKMALKTVKENLIQASSFYGKSDPAE